MALDLRNVNSKDMFREDALQEEVRLTEEQRKMQRVESIDPSVVGSLSNKFEFVATLGNPAVKNKERLVCRDGSVINHAIDNIVGYRFRALVDYDRVPDVDTTMHYYYDPMDHSLETRTRKRSVKAGEVFDLTHFEMAVFLTNPEFNGEVKISKDAIRSVSKKYRQEDEDENPRVIIAYSEAKDEPDKRADGRLMYPLAYLRSSKGFRIRTFPQIPVIECRSEVQADGRVVKHKLPLEEFPKWAPLAQSRRPTQRSIQSSIGLKDNVRDNLDMFNI